MGRDKQIWNSAPTRKIALRKRIIDLIGEPLRVLETHSGPAVMRKACYGEAKDWLGIDKDPKSPDAIHADSRHVLRCIDIDRFNLFDVDAFGSPWEHVWLVSQRRAAKGRIALAITSGVQGGFSSIIPTLKSAGWSTQMLEAMGCSGEAPPRRFVGQKGASRAARTYVGRWFHQWTIDRWLEVRNARGTAWYFGAVLQAHA